MEGINIEDYIQRSRIRSLRRRKRSAIESQDKRLIQLHDEEVMLSKQMRSLEWITLNPPYQRGWNRTFVLRSDVKREKKAPLYQKVLDKINTVQWSSRKDFKKKRRRFGKKVYVLREQPLSSVRGYEFYSKRFTDEERLLFCEMLMRDKQGRTERFFLFNEPWRFVLQIKPNMITKVQIKSSQYERRAGEIDRLFITHHLRPRLWKLLDCNYSWKSKADEVNPMMNVSFATILNEHWEAVK